MAVIKCKMCGGSLQISEDSSVCECEYCGTKQTVPKADDEKKLKLFDRAGRLLRGCEFDKAAGVFESIVADFPEEAEAYWGLVLCKYGIEYVDDPSTGKKIPTCHRSSFDSVLDDQNFEQACEFSEPVARRVYRDEARAIEALRQAILQVSGREEPYDVFISYKETDGEGQRTLDSVIAQDIYKELTNEGYRVFFSRISLEDKLGTEYEPYIFAALNSARVMIVVGTDYENFDAVWVKNEWSRFLKLIAKGEKKTLIPVFKNMDAYDMPKEFLKLSAQDMGKVGAMQDLLRGVEKILGKKQAEPAPAQQVIQQVIQGGGPNVTALLKRGRQALEDGAWEKADGFYEQVLSMDAENGEAFLGKFCAEAHAFSLDSALDGRLRRADGGLRSAERQIERQSAREQRLVAENTVPGYLKADRLTPLLPQKLDYPSALDYRQRTKTNEMIALHTNKLLTRAERYAKGELAGEIKSSLSRFEGELDARIRDAETATVAAKAEREKTYEAELRQAEESAEKLRREAEEKREQDYQACCRALEQAQTREQYRDVEQKLGQPGLKQYKDCAALAERCRDGIAALQEKERRAALQKQEEAYQAAAGLERKARTEEEFRAAVSAFRALGDFRDAESHAKALQEQADALKAKAEAEAAERLREQQAREARALAAKKKKQRLIAILASAAVVLAVAAFLVVTKVILPGNAYKAAESLLEAGQYEEAAAAFEALGDYKDAPDQMLEAKYLHATALEEAGNYSNAAAAFESLGNYKDSSERARGARNQAKYAEASELLESGRYEQAAAAFAELGDYQDAPELASLADNEAHYLEASALLDSGSYQEALDVFEKLGRFRDSRDMVLETKYQWAASLLEGLGSMTSYEDAMAAVQQSHDLLESVGSYKNAEELLGHFMRVRLCDKMQNSGHVAYYTYDAKGRLTGIPRIDAYESVRIDPITYNGNDVASWYTVYSNASYDDQHRLIGYEGPLPIDGSSTVTYNEKGLISRITSKDGEIRLSYEYENGMVVHCNYQNKTKYSTYSYDHYYSYDANGRVIEYTYKSKDMKSEYQFRYSYNRDGTLAKIEEQNKNKAESETILVEYGYIFVSEPLSEEDYMQITQQLTLGNTFYCGLGCSTSMPFVFTFYTT